MNFKYELKRIASPILIGAVALLIALAFNVSRTNLETVVFKFLIFCPSIALVHVSRRMMFPYINLGRLVREADEIPSSVRAATIAGVFLYYAILTYALTQAI
jgi:hypothetical protein